MGDHAVGTLLDAIGDARARVGDAPARMFVVEHGGLIGGHIAQAAGLGVHVTVQQALLDGLAPALAAWGADRTAALFPWRDLVDAGAWISAGTDHPIGPLSRCARRRHDDARHPAGVLGPSTRSAGRRHCASTPSRAPASSAARRGTLVTGAPADLVAYRADPFTCPDEELPALSLAATIIAGQLAHRGV